MLTILMSLIACDFPPVVQSCNLMYAPNTLTLEVDADWTGVIQLDVSGDGERISCTLGEDESSTACDDLGSTIELSDDLLVVSLFDFTPDVVEVLIEDDSGSQSFTLEPSYALDEPNGPGCGERRLGTESLTL